MNKITTYLFLILFSYILPSFAFSQTISSDDPPQIWANEATKRAIILGSEQYLVMASKVIEKHGYIPELVARMEIEIDLYLSNYPLLPVNRLETSLIGLEQLKAEFGTVPKLLLRLGVGYHMNNQYAQAVKNYSNWLAITPVDHPLYLTVQTALKDAKANYKRAPIPILPPEFEREIPILANYFGDINKGNKLQRVEYTISGLIWAQVSFFIGQPQKVVPAKRVEGQDGPCYLCAEVLALNALGRNTEIDSALQQIPASTQKTVLEAINKPIKNNGRDSLEKEIKDFENEKDQDRRYSIHNYFALRYLEIGQPSKAREHIDEAIKIFEKKDNWHKTPCAFSQRAHIPALVKLNPNEALNRVKKLVLAREAVEYSFFDYSSCWDSLIKETAAAGNDILARKFIDDFLESSTIYHAGPYERILKGRGYTLGQFLKNDRERGLKNIVSGQLKANRISDAIAGSSREGININGDLAILYLNKRNYAKFVEYNLSRSDGALTETFQNFGRVDAFKIFITEMTGYNIYPNLLEAIPARNN